MEPKPLNEVDVEKAPARERQLDRTDPATDPLLRGGGHIPPGALCDPGPPPQASVDELPPTPLQRPPGHSSR